MLMHMSREKYLIMTFIYEQGNLEGYQITQFIDKKIQIFENRTSI